MTGVDWSDPAARREWLELLRAKVVDLVAVAEDAAKPRLERFFSRAEQRRRIAELERGLLGLLEEGAGSLRPVAVGPTMPPGRSSDDDAKGPPSTLRPV